MLLITRRKKKKKIKVISALRYSLLETTALRLKLKKTNQSTSKSYLQRPKSGEIKQYNPKKPTNGDLKI